MPLLGLSQRCTLEINVISAEDLRIKGRPIKKYAIVHVNPNTRGKGIETTMDWDGGSNPIWREKYDLTIKGNTALIFVHVYSGDKFIGRATISMAEIFDDYVPPHCLHFLSYRLQDRRCRPNGIINLSIRAKEIW